MLPILEARKPQIHETGAEPFAHGLRKAEPGRLGQPAGVRVLRIARGALSDRRRRAPGSRPHRLRGLHVGHPRLALFGTGTAPAELLHRPARTRRDLWRREEALPGLDRTDRPVSSQRGVRLLDLHRGHHRRRRGRGVPPRRVRAGHPRAADPIGRLSRHEERRLPRGLRRPGQTRRHRFRPTASARRASTSWATSIWPAKPG